MLTDHVRYLSETIGPRPPASPAEKKAVDYVREQFEALGYDTQTDEFPALRTFSRLHILHYIMFIAAWSLFPTMPVLSVLLCLVGLVSFTFNVSGFSGLSVFFPKSRSRNVVAYRVPARPSVRKVIVSSHVDSSRSALLFHPMLVKNFRCILLADLVAMASTLAAAIIFAAGFRPVWLWAAAGILDIQLAAALLILVDMELRGRHTAGADANASGVAAMLGAAAELSGDKFRHTEIEFVATGAKVSGLFGMIHHLEKNWHDKTRTYVINIDHVGIGDITVTSGEGILIRKKTGARLLEAATSINLENAGRPPCRLDLCTMLTDGYAALIRGFDSISIMAFMPDGTLPNRYRHADTVENISGCNLSDASLLVAQMIRNIETESESVVKRMRGGQ